MAQVLSPEILPNEVGTVKKQLSDKKVSAPLPVNTCSCHTAIDLKDEKCFLCNNSDGSEGLHSAATYNIDAKVRNCAIALNDSALLAKLEPGDVIAQEAKYHRKYLVNLYNRAKGLDRATQDKDSEADLHGIAFAELVAHMEDLWKEDIAPVFKLTDLTQMYKDRLQKLGAVVEGRAHSSRLKDRLLSVLPDLQARYEGNSIILSFYEDFSAALRKAWDFDDDAMHLVCAVQIVHNKMFEMKYSFNGCFKNSTEQDAVPTSLLE